MSINQLFPQGFELKSTGGYLKFDSPETRFRIVTPILPHWRYFNKSNQVNRSLGAYNGVPGDVKVSDKGKREKPSIVFLCGVIHEGELKTLEVSQRTIQSAIINLAQDPDWGMPDKYDIKVLKKGAGINTEYNVQPGKPCDLTGDEKQTVDGIDPYIYLATAFLSKSYDEIEIKDNQVTYVTDLIKKLFKGEKVNYQFVKSGSDDDADAEIPEGQRLIDSETQKALWKKAQSLGWSQDSMKNLLETYELKSFTQINFDMHKLLLKVLDDTDLLEEMTNYDPAVPAF